MQEFEVGTEKFVSLNVGEVYISNNPVVVKSGRVSEFIDNVWVGLQGASDTANATSDDSCSIHAEEPSVLHLVDCFNTYNTLNYIQRRSKFMQMCVKFHTAKSSQAKKRILALDFQGLSITQLSSNLQVSYGTIQKILASNGS